MQTVGIRTWSVYCLLEGRHVRYIGITSQRPERRLLQHYADASRRRTDHKTNWIRHCLAEGIQVEIRVVKSGLLREKAEQSEVRLLRFFRKAFKLVNSHEGGASGYAGLSEESKVKHAESGKTRYINNPADRERLLAANAKRWDNYRKKQESTLAGRKIIRRIIVIDGETDVREAVFYDTDSLRDARRKLRDVLTTTATRP